MSTSREELRTLLRNFLRTKVAGPLPVAAHYNIRLTSGTSGKPLVSLLPFSWNSAPPPPHYGGVALIASGSMNNRFTVTTTAQRQSSVTAARVLSVGREDFTHTETLGALLQDFAPDRIIGIPSLLLRLGQLMGPAARGVKHSLLFGEPMTPTLTEALQKTFPNATLSSVYISMELGMYSTAPCGHLPHGQYHPAHHVRVRIDQPDDTGAGDVLLSLTFENDFSVKDYSTGDVGRLLHTPCACGEPSTLEILGRRGRDYIKVAGALVRSAEFERVAAQVPLITDFRVEVSTRFKNALPQGHIEMFVYAASGIGTDGLREEIKDTFEKELFLTPTKTFAQLISEGLFEPLVLTWVKAPFAEGYKHIRMKEIL